MGSKDRCERHKEHQKSTVPPNKGLERTRYERASLLSCVGEPLKRIVSLPR